MRHVLEHNLERDDLDHGELLDDGGQIGGVGALGLGLGADVGLHELPVVDDGHQPDAVLDAMLDALDGGGSGLRGESCLGWLLPGS